MKLVDLVSYFRNGGSYEVFCKSQSLNAESEVVEIYMNQPFQIDKDLVFFEIEKTGGSVEFSLEGVKYSNLFDFYYFLDAIEESNASENQHLTNEAIADRLYNYALNDA